MFLFLRISLQLRKINSQQGQQQQKEQQHRNISNSSKTTYQDETFILNLLPNLLGDTA